nr:hypothetical protein CFP56_76801 [Quercus suber]
MPTSNGLFDGLPVELRLKVWAEVFSFANPLRLRQQTRDPVDVSMLCTNRHLYEEVLDVFFAQNTILASRSDFCFKSGLALKHPMPFRHVRHLIVQSFGESLQCLSYKTQCTSCKYPGLDFFEVLQCGIPSLRTVVVDYHAHVKLFWGFQDALKTSSAPKLNCTSLGLYKLSHLALPGLDVTFQNLPIVKTYPSLRELAARKPTGEQKKATLRELRPLNHDVGTLWYLMCESEATGDERTTFSTHLQKFWVCEQNLHSLDDGQRSKMLSDFTDSVQECLELEGPALCRKYSDLGALAGC